MKETSELEERVTHLAARLEMQSARIRSLHAVVNALYAHLGLMQEPILADSVTLPNGER